MILHYFHCQSRKKTFADVNDNGIEERSASSTNASSNFRAKLGHVMKATESAGHAGPCNGAGRTPRRPEPYLHCELDVLPVPPISVHATL